jgi:thiol:disulfide interchange protein DsbD
MLAMMILRTLAHLIIATCLLVATNLQTPAHAEGAPEDVFRYVIFDAGDALEIDWALDEGAFLYADELGFESGDPGVTLMAPEFPASDSGKFDSSFFVRIPYEASGTKPDVIPVTIKSRGGVTGGDDYPPQTWIETVELAKPKAATKKLDLSNLGGGSQAEFPPPDEVFFPDLIAIDGNTIELGFRIIPEFYLYRNRLSVRIVGDSAYAEKLMLPDGKIHTDEFFGEQQVYYNEVFGRIYVARASSEATELSVEVNYQGCADAGLCYVPLTEVLTVKMPAAGAISDIAALTASAQPVSDHYVPPLPEGEVVLAGVAPVDIERQATAPVSAQSKFADVILNDSIWAMIGVFLGAGLLLSFTPCVLPMIPILSGIIAGDGDNVSPMRGFLLALSYVMGMAIVYTGAGIAAAAAGLQLQAAFNQPWVLILFAALFVVLAISMFGAFDLQMPSSVQSKLAGASGNQKSGTVIGAFVMGAISALVVTACVAPALIAALTVIAQTGDMVRGGVALFALSIGMGAPLLLVGAAQGQLLPKAGAWMVAVKGAFGFMMLGLAVWMLSRILPGGVTMTLWAVLIFMSGVFMGGLTTLGTDSGIAQKLGKGFGLLGILYGLILFLGALSGGTNPLKPLASLQFVGGSSSVAEQKHLEFKRIKTVEDLDRELAAAAASGKSAMLDFYADWCVSCIEMEEYTFITSEVQTALSNTVALQADVTKNDAEDQELLKRFGVFGPPTIIFFGTDGKQLEGYEVVGFMPSDEFANHVSSAFTL